MAEHNVLGKAGEDAAVKYLEKHDYVIRHRNWRRGHLELDIVAAKDDMLVIVEVKTRSNTEVQEPYEAVPQTLTSRSMRWIVPFASTSSRWWAMPIISR